MVKYLYVAGSSAELPRVKSMVAQVEQLNSELAHQGDRIEITHRWWDLVEALGANPAVDSNQRRNWAADDLAGVKDCDIFFCLWPSEPTGSGGCMWESGYADAMDCEMVFAGPTTRSIFPSRGAEFQSDESAFEYLRDLVYNDFDALRYEIAGDVERV
jgi:hypothetical protein